MKGMKRQEAGGLGSDSGQKSILQGFKGWEVCDAWRGGASLLGVLDCRSREGEGHFPASVKC